MAGVSRQRASTWLCLAALATALGCSDKRQKPRSRDGSAATTGNQTSRPEAAPSDEGTPLHGSRQLVVLRTADWKGVDARLELYAREGGKQPWQRQDVWMAAVGHGGLGWGIGVHGEGRPKGATGPAKREGDGRSPAGVFALTAAYGYAKSAKTQLPYSELTADWRCVDDPGSDHYGRVFDAAGMKVDWNSAEEMRRSDELYRWVIHVDHNPRGTPKRGSCIFLHVWGADGQATIGCAAMPEERMRGLLAWLNPEAKPLLVALPEAEYSAFASRWHLP